MASRRGDKEFAGEVAVDLSGDGSAVGVNGVGAELVGRWRRLGEVVRKVAYFGRWGRFGGVGVGSLLVEVAEGGYFRLAEVAADVGGGEARPGGEVAGGDGLEPGGSYWVARGGM